MKRILSLTFSVLLVLSMLVTPAKAEGDCITYTERTLVFFCLYDITWVACRHGDSWGFDQSSVLVDCGFPELP